MVWSDARSDAGDVYGAVVDTSSHTASAPFPITAATGMQYHVDTAGDLVVWTDYQSTDPDDPHDVWGAEVDWAARTVGAPVPIAASEWLSEQEGDIRGTEVSFWELGLVANGDDAKVADAMPGSAVVKVRILIKSATSKTVKTLQCGTRPANKALTYRFKCKLKKGGYRFFVYATDLAGNAQGKIGRAALRVR